MSSIVQHGLRRRRRARALGFAYLLSRSVAPHPAGEVPKRTIVELDTQVLTRRTERVGMIIPSADDSGRVLVAVDPEEDGPDVLYLEGALPNPCSRVVSGGGDPPEYWSRKPLWRIFPRSR